MERVLAQRVRRRAAGLCEYCRMPEPVFVLEFEIDHVIAEQHGGTSEFGNLALSCPRCNPYKGPNVASIDPETQKLVPLFNPRLHVWSEHFEWLGARIHARTPIGRATIRCLNLNHPGSIAVRESLITERRFPP